jgi:FkbM family methyltransferase
VIKKFIRKILLASGLYFRYLVLREKYFPSRMQRKEQEDLQDRKKFYSRLVSNGYLCFDIGANLGNRTAAFVALGANVIAVEPQEYCCGYLKTKFKNNVTVLKKGCDTTEETKEFFVANYHAASSFSREWITTILPNKFNDVSIEKTEKIETTTLDKLIMEYGLPDFCKIDVEGYELQVIKGLTQPVNVISFEFTFPELKEKAVDCLEYLNNLGKITCNFAQNESMEFGLDKWADLPEFLGIIKSPQFDRSSHGDIYVSFIPQNKN